MSSQKFRQKSLTTYCDLTQRVIYLNRLHLFAMNILSITNMFNNSVSLIGIRHD